MRKLNKFLLWAFLLSPGMASAQHFAFSAKLNEVTETGFHSIQLTPELSSHLSIGLGDLRIIDTGGRQVPYVIQTKLSRIKKDYFQSLPIVEITQKDSGSTHLVIQNNTGRDLDGLNLILRNAATERTARISGSDDGNTWFIIAENLHIPPVESLENDRFLVKMNFPRSSYRYLRVIIFNGKSDPLNVLEAGVITTSLMGGWRPLIMNPGPLVTQVDSTDGYSYINVVQREAYHVAALQIRLNGAKLYRRTVTIDSTGAAFEASSANDLFEVPAFQKKEIRIKIFNGDNPPLQVGQLATFQLAREIICYLEKGSQYTILMGNPQATAPSYDLQTFTDSIPSNPNSLSYQAITASLQPVAEKPSKPVTLWLVIGGVIALLAFLTRSLTYEMSKKQ